MYSFLSSKFVNQGDIAKYNDMDADDSAEDLNSCHSCLAYRRLAGSLYMETSLESPRTQRLGHVNWCGRSHGYYGVDSPGCILSCGLPRTWRL